MARDRDIPEIARVRIKSAPRPVVGVVRRRRDGSYSRIVCKGCGEEIAGLRGGKQVRHPNYVEASIKFSDNSFHVTHACRDCLANLIRTQNIEEMERWYVTDLQDWIDSIELVGAGSISAAGAVRVPIQIREQV